jgi:hypothetical protein
MVLLKNFVNATLICFFFCSFLAEVFVSNAVAGESEESKVVLEAKRKVKSMYSELQMLAKTGASGENVAEFLTKHFDVAVIAKRFGIEWNLDFQKSLAKFLHWRFKNDAVKTVTTAILGENFAVTEKKSSVIVRGNLSSEETTVNFTAIFVLDQTLGKLKELIIVGIPLIEGITSIIGKYCEKHGLNPQKMTSAERDKVFRKAINCFLAGN